MFSRLSTVISLSLAMSCVALVAPGGLSRRQNPVATFFFQGGNPGACGVVHSDQDLIVAIPTADYANGAHCGQSVSITDTQTGVTQTGVVADECPGCGPGSIDLSVGLFEEFAPQSQGVFPVSWSFI